MLKTFFVAVGACAAVLLLSMQSAAAATNTTISNTPLFYDSTNGDILAITKVAGAATNELAIGGNFTAVKTPDGVSHAATNFAILAESTGKILYAGKANSYVRAVSSFGGTVYAGGDFTSFGGVTRSHMAALNSSFAVTPFNPAPSARVRAITADSTGVYLGGDNGSVRKVAIGTAAPIWSQPISRGGTKALQLTPDHASLFVAGLFETYGGVTRHGLVRAAASTGKIVTTFNANLKPDSGVGKYGSYDGEDGISFALTPEGTNLIVGIGGHTVNEARKLNINTGARVWNTFLVGDCQAIVNVGNSYVAGYHRSTTGTAPQYPYIAAQLTGSGGTLVAAWNPRITGNQSNADGGNNGVQAAYSDPSTHTLFLAGAFTHWNGQLIHQSLIAFSYA